MKKLMKVYKSEEDADFQRVWEEILAIEYDHFANRYYELEDAWWGKITAGE
jgi:hypothetical protein